MNLVTLMVVVIALLLLCAGLLIVVFMRMPRGDREQSQSEAFNRLELGLRAQENTLREQIDRVALHQRQELAQTLDRLGQLQLSQLQVFEQRLAQTQTDNKTAADVLRATVDEKLRLLQADSRQAREDMSSTLQRHGSTQTEALTALTQQNEQKAESLRLTVENRLRELQADNALKLEKMRETVDEKLHNTLEQRLGDSFKLVSERLELVQRGLGEMQQLASGVGDLKRVLTNVRTRGTWGEVQLGALLEQVLAAEQYAKDVVTKPGSNERVEYAVKMPGSGEGTHVWLPIDAKFPIEDFQRLQDAQDRLDKDAVIKSGDDLERRIRDEAKKIRDKYIDVPHTTEFGILFLPTESLYAEVLRRPGLQESLLRDLRINIAGPTTLAAILNSLQMGFRTLAIEKRSSEVWNVLGAVKTEFGKFGESLAQTRKKLEEASNKIGDIETRSRVMRSKLKSVEAMPATQVEALLGMDESTNDEAEN